MLRYWALVPLFKICQDDERVVSDFIMNVIANTDICTLLGEGPLVYHYVALVCHFLFSGGFPRARHASSFPLSSLAKNHAKPR